MGLEHQAIFCYFPWPTSLFVYEQSRHPPGSEDNHKYFATFSGVIYSLTLAPWLAIHVHLDLLP